MNLAEFCGKIPGLEELKSRLQKLALMDALILPDWERRYFSFDMNWGSGESLATIRNGSGAEAHVLLRSSAALVLVSDHDLPSLGSSGFLPDLERRIPAELVEYLHEPAFCYGGTFAAASCSWRTSGDSGWHFATANCDHGLLPFNALGLIAGGVDVNGYVDHVVEVYEVEPSAAFLRTVDHVLHGSPEMARAIIDGRYGERLADISQDIVEIGIRL
ncbi:hypothetical protein [Actinocorallia sp. A-T 12471]|uniref:hypothetical protein n=1 Tax=Actinocorallia sp. A-T 12471 TaxID=3089813 RepID=UPI0029CFBA71|nr:hypothetical protein [Actinocorallia sp. A-T 12471]MDX6740108.1 hypothetical protein [Actinocorallia sp. A-T 12471]